MGYQRKRYTGLSDGPNIMDVIKGKANQAATNIVGGAANAAAGSVNNAFKGVKLPDVNVAISPDTKKVIYTGVGILGGSLLLAAIVFKK